MKKILVTMSICSFSVFEKLSPNSTIRSNFKKPIIHYSVFVKLSKTNIFVIRYLVFGPYSLFVATLMCYNNASYYGMAV